MNNLNELLLELVESEHWLALKAAANEYSLTFRSAALAESNNEWDFIVRERNAHTARAFPAFFTHVETRVKNYLKKEKDV